MANNWILIWYSSNNAGTVVIRVCPLAAVPDGSVRMLEVVGADLKPLRLLVLREAERVWGYENRCPHFGVPLAAKEQQLIFEPGVSLTCNTHYARFRWRDGVCDRGDCEGEALTAVALSVSAGWVVLNDTPRGPD
jgi:nitrite reductase/ring-hydroxylating ferredoxin subunit